MPRSGFVRGIAAAAAAIASVARAAFPAARTAAAKGFRARGAPVTILETTTEMYGTLATEVLYGTRFGSFDMKPGMRRAALQFKRNGMPKIDKHGKPYFDIPLHLDKADGKPTNIIPRSPREIRSGWGDPKERGRVIFRRFSSLTAFDRWVHPGFMGKTVLQGRHGRVQGMLLALRPQVQAAFDIAVKKEGLKR